jgi:hypothetical protein
MKDSAKPPNELEPTIAPFPFHRRVAPKTAQRLSAGFDGRSPNDALQLRPLPPLRARSRGSRPRRTP